MKKTIALLTLSLLLFSCGGGGEIEASYDIIPLPQKIELGEGKEFRLTSATQVVYPEGDEELERIAGFFSDYVRFATDIVLKVVPESGAAESNLISLKSTLEGDNAERYRLDVSEGEIVIEGASRAGVFYGLQSLRKIIGVGSKSSVVTIKEATIDDYPRFGYRGVHLDVARHMFPTEFIKKYIDILALHNANRLHWHLTDDQGWRIEIKSHPLLTELGSVRNETVIGRNSGKYDGKEYGGYYTQEEIREIVEYAAERYITIVPEIDLPGHMLGALKAYPELGCTGGPYEVWTMWGVADDVLCAGNEETYQFIEDVLTEVMELFPSELIHIGGDECPKVRWEECAKCQAKIAELGLGADDTHSAEQKLQSHVTAFAEKLLNDNGRRLIGWDEILEGGLEPSAVVMSWRGMKGGIEAAQLGNDVVMTPNDYLYFDYYQTTNRESVPLAIGGYVPLEKVYSLDPIPAVLTPEEGRHILGVQANMWTEYMKTSDHVEYMLLPRLAALSEVQWTMPNKKKYEGFTKRLMRLMEYYDKLELNYSTSAFDISAQLEVRGNERSIEVTLSTIDNAPIHYTTNGSRPTANSELYTKPIIVDQTTDLKAEAVRPSIESATYSREFNFNKGTLSPIVVNPTPHPRFNVGGAQTLVDGIKGGKSDYGDGSWLGFYNCPMVEAIIDLGEPTKVSKAMLSTFVATSDWIFGATGIDILVSDDNNKFLEVATERYDELREHITEVVEYELDFEPTEARYVKFVVHKNQLLPEWHVGAGAPSFIFIDELGIE